MRSVGWSVLALVAAGCSSTGFDHSLEPPRPSMLSTHEPAVHIAIHEERSEIEVVAGPFHVPVAEPSADHHGHSEDDAMKSPLITVPWPVDGGLVGYRMAVYGSEGTALSRELLHHVIGVNFTRSQLIYPVPERILGFGTETPDIRLPSSLEVPLERGDSLGIYAMWNNVTGEELDGVYLQIAFPYSPNSARRQKALPVYFDTNNNIGGKTSYDLPPGPSTRAYEFELPVGGGLLAASGHLHDYGVELRLEEAVTGRVLTTLRPERDSSGRVTSVEQRIYRRFFRLIDARIALEAGVRYRVVGVYDNPMGETIPDGGMAHIVGLFVPDDVEAWPELDRTSQAYRADVEALPAPLGEAHVHR